MFDMLKQLKEMKSKVEDFKKSIENAAFFGQDSNNVVKVKISGKGALLDIDISKNLINIQGNLDSKIMIITNIPSSEEDKEGKVLVGENYDLFINILSSINLSLNDFIFSRVSFLT